MSRLRLNDAERAEAMNALRQVLYQHPGNPTQWSALNKLERYFGEEVTERTTPLNALYAPSITPSVSTVFVDDRWKDKYCFIVHACADELFVRRFSSFASAAEARKQYLALGYLRSGST